MERIQPWSVDADRITVRDDWRDIALVTNGAIDRFLETRDKFFVVAAKGFGKTLLLKTKSKQYRDAGRAARFYPPLDLCEKIGHPTTATFSHEDLAGFTQRTTWRNVWESILLLVVARTFGLALPPDLANLFGDAESATDLLNALLRDRRNFAKHTAATTQALRPLIRRLTEPVVLFFDNVDEALDDHVARSLTHASKPLSEQVWINAQLGLMDAVKAVHFANREVRVFATVRVEAFRQSETPLTLQLRDYCTLLEYTKSELRAIFENNIQLMRPRDLAQSSDGPMSKLFGFASLRHGFARRKGKPLCEDVFDHVLRHTFGRPRELVVMGERISAIAPHERTPETVAAVVNRESTELLEQYRKEIAPWFDEVEYGYVADEVRRNVLTRGDVLSISRRIADRSVYGHVFCSLYRKGLLGCVKKASDGTWTQLFQPVAEHIFDEEPLPASPFYLLHPALEEDLRRRHPEFRFDQRNIVGNGYDFVPPSRRRSPPPEDARGDETPPPLPVPPPGPPREPQATEPDDPPAAPQATPIATPAPRTAVFVSYSRRDEKWLRDIKAMLAPVTRDGGLDVWDDTRIPPGADFQRAIASALARARVAVLLVSRAYLESDFIAKHEFLQCLQLAEREGASVIWVLLEECMYEHTPIARLNAVHDPGAPLERMKASERHKVLKHVCRTIVGAAGRA